MEVLKERKMSWKDLFPKENRYFETENGILYCGDCLEIMKKFPKESIDLIYIDPPYGIDMDKKFGIKWKSTEKHYKFCDNLGLGIIRKIDIKGKKSNFGLAHYLQWIYPRLVLMKELLNEQGNIYIHLDYHLVHYIKILMDEIFGKNNFLNEIIWYYKHGSITKNRFSHRHDTLLLYIKSETYFYNGVAVGDLREQKTFGSFFGIDENGRKYRIIKKKGKIYKYYLDEPKNPDDVWIVNKISERDKTERTGFPTQKPKELLERVIKASSNKNFIIGDFFAGSGTT